MLVERKSAIIGARINAASNSAKFEGGFLSIHSGAISYIRESILKNNRTQSGGAVSLFSTAMALHFTEISGNSASSITCTVSGNSDGGGFNIFGGLYSPPVSHRFFNNRAPCGEGGHISIRVTNQHYPHLNQICCSMAFSSTSSTSCPNNYIFEKASGTPTLQLASMRIVTIQHG